MRPSVTGITSIGIDHVPLLGHTLPEIAWHKAGIQKAGCLSLTVDQPTEVLSVIQQRSVELGVSCLEVVKFDPRLNGVKIIPDLDHQKSNASLAVRLAEVCLKEVYGLPEASELAKEVKIGLETSRWRGRCEVLQEDSISWCLDGAHTAESLVIAIDWFRQLVLKEFV